MKLDRAGMQALMEANVAAERRGDLDAAMAFQTDDPELELWGVRRRRDLFEKVYQRELEATSTRVVANRSSAVDV